MNTRERAIALADAASSFPFLGPTRADDLLALVAAELGHPDALDRFVPHGAHLARAFPPALSLHVVAANTPAAALQSLVRGLLLGGQHVVKLPTGGMAEVGDFLARLPTGLRERVHLSEELDAAALAAAEALIVFGSDETVVHFRPLVQPEQRFVAHGHQVSFGVVFADPEFASIENAARDVCAFDQLGCLSPVVVYVGDPAREYAVRLAQALAEHEAREPRGAVSLSVANAIRALREETAFRAANGETCAVWQSEGSTAWTVLYDEAPGFPHTPLHRTIFVKPLPPDFASELAKVRTHVSCAGIFPATEECAARLTSFGIDRICPIGRMQQPPWTWHQDGAETLAPLVRWVDLETR
jgi:hypothetical protein